MEASFYQSAVEKSPIGFANHKMIFNEEGNPIDYEYLDANNAFLKIFGLENENIIGKRASEVFPDFAKRDSSWIKTYGELAINGGEMTFERYSVGYDSWFHVNAYSVKKGYFMSWLTNISREVQDMEEKQALMETISDIVFVVDENLIINNLITSDEQMLFAPREIIIGSSIYKLLPEQLSDIFADAIQKVGTSGEKEHLKYQSPIPNDERWFEATVSEILFKNHKKFIVSINDITSQMRLELELKVKTDELERFFNINLDLLCIADMEGHFIKVNKSWEDILGYTTEELITKKFLEFVHPDDLEATLNAMSKLAENEKVLYFVNRYKTVDGSYRYIEWISQPYGELIYAAARDITDRKLTEEALTISEERFNIAMKGTSAGLWDWDMKNNTVFYSSQWATMLGYEPEEIKNTFESWKELWHPDEKEKIEQTIKNYMSGKTKVYEVDHRLKCKNGQWRWILTRGEIYKDASGKPVRWTGTNIDITHIKEVEEKILYLSNHDQLTGLFNRRYYEEELLKIDNMENLPISLIMGDLNGLKRANDNFGHLIGDKLIQKAAEVMKKKCRSQDIICRIGGDEFVIILPKTKDDEAEILVKRIRRAMKKTKVDNLEVSVAFGWASKLFSRESMEDVFKKAEEEMYRSKSTQTDR